MPLTNYAFADLITFTRSTTATFVGSNGLIQSAAINAPRFDFSPVTLAPLGLLIEEQRVNLSLYSAEFDNAGWLKTNSTITANATTAPDGTLAGDKHVPNLGATLGPGASETRVYQSISVTSGVTYMFSIYAKAGEYNEIEFAITVSPSATARFSLTSGTVISGTGASITSAGNGWYRCAVTAVAASTGTVQTRWSAEDSVALVGDGTSGIFVWGAQFEAGAFTTSYIPTVAATVTRATDQAVMTGTAFSNWFNASEGTFVASATTMSTASRRGVYAATDNSGTNANRIYLSVTTEASNFVSTASVAQADVIIAGVISDNTVFKDAFAYRENDISAAANGVLGTPDTSATLPVVSELRLGARSDGSIRLNGHLRNITYYPTRLSDAQLQALTV
jgi:hypothetical protein